jgi:tetratricopeptide (TPR) repeat protein
MVIKRTLKIGLIMLMTFGGGCAPFSGGIGSLKGFWADPEERFAKGHLKKARAFEKKGDLSAARRAYTLALVVYPQDQEAGKGLKRVERELHDLARRHYRAGLRLHRKGEYGRARHQFLIALRLWPDFPEVVGILTAKTRPRTKTYIVHTIKPGQSLSKVAKIYYGDYRKFSIIAKYNNINDATKIEVGQKIKVPEIEGVKFKKGKEKVKAKKKTPVRASTKASRVVRRKTVPKVQEEHSRRQSDKESVETQAPEVLDPAFWDLDKFPLMVEGATAAPEADVEGDNEEPVDQVEIYRDQGIALFSDKKYQEAGIEFEKVLNSEPEDGVALEYAYLSHFQRGKAFYEERDYLAARDQFRASLRYKRGSRKSLEYLNKSENVYKEIHYKRGIQYFGKERLNEALKEWKLVSAVDPDYKRVDYLIRKAENILEKVEKLKQRQAE